MMDEFADFLQAVGYHAVLIRPLLPMNLHLILSALFPIYAGAHASLTRPSSAAKPSKKGKAESVDDEDQDEQEQRMEGLSPLDAITLPLGAAAMLGGLYYLIKLLDDPTILSKILNWYFSIFGVFTLARFIDDSMSIVTSFVLPSMYTSQNQIWEIDAKQKQAKTTSSSSGTRQSPLPGYLSTLSLPTVVMDFLWVIRILPSHKLRVRAFIRNVIDADVKVGPQGSISFLIALVAQLYYNIVDKPWWLTNALGFSLAYGAIQLISPTTSSTGSLILCALFVYDVYFVFFTPLMVTVATQLDIPAKLLFPRPSGLDEDPAKQAFSMLGLGDIVLPGMMIGFGLRFDLYLFYLRKQTIREDDDHGSKPESALDISTSERRIVSTMVKDDWYPARGGWGERFWTSRQAIITSKHFHGTIFPKTYFHASLVGYVIGLICTLGVMQLFGHAQPALLYLVPGVLGAVWGTAFFKGDIKTLWTYSEADEEEEKQESEQDTGQEVGGRKWENWKRTFFSSGAPKTSQGKGTVEDDKGRDHSSEGKSTESVPKKSKQSNSMVKSTADSRVNKCHERHRSSELMFFSINLPTSISKSPMLLEEEENSTTTPPSNALNDHQHDGADEASAEDNATRRLPRAKSFRPSKSKANLEDGDLVERGSRVQTRKMRAQSLLGKGSENEQ